MIPQNKDSEPRLPDLRNLGDQKQVEKARGNWYWWFALPVALGLAFWWAAWGWGNTGGYLWGFRSATHDNPTNGAIENRALTNGVDSASGGIPNNNVRSNSPNAPAPGTPSAVVHNGPPASGPGLQVLDALNKQQFIGKHFQADNVAVERKVNDRALWIADSSKEPMLVVINGGPNSSPSSAQIQPGSPVDATGTVKTAPPSFEAKQKWDLSDDDVARLEKEGVYIQVSQLTVPPAQP
jgi:hypothetical protein